MASLDVRFSNVQVEFDNAYQTAAARVPTTTMGKWSAQFGEAKQQFGKAKEANDAKSMKGALVLMETIVEQFSDTYGV